MKLHGFPSFFIGLFLWNGTSNAKKGDCIICSWTKFAKYTNVHIHVVSFFLWLWFHPFLLQNYVLMYPYSIPSNRCHYFVYNITYSCYKSVIILSAFKYDLCCSHFGFHTTHVYMYVPFFYRMEHVFLHSRFVYVHVLY